MFNITMFDGETIILLALLNLSEIGADISNCNVYIAPITLSSDSYWLLKNICIYKYAYKERERGHYLGLLRGSQKFKKFL